MDRDLIVKILRGFKNGFKYSRLDGKFRIVRLIRGRGLSVHESQDEKPVGEAAAQDLL